MGRKRFNCFLFAQTIAPKFQTSKYEPNRSLLFTNLLVLVPTAVMARPLNFSAA